MYEFLTKRRTLRKKTLAAIWVGTVMFVYLSISIPLAMDNGMDKFSGVELGAAQVALHHDQAVRGGITTHLTKARVDAVYPNPGKRPCTGTVSDDPNNIQYYTVHISYHQLFGITESTSHVDLCRAR